MADVVTALWQPALGTPPAHAARRLHRPAQRRPADDSAPAARLAFEIETARLTSEGRSNAEVAQQLEVTLHTPRHHVGSVRTKLGVHTRAEVGAKLRK